jgi:hypothetical protein
VSLRKLQREWYAKAAASGFVDLEGPGGDGPLSDRGNLHPVDTTVREAKRLGERVQDGQTFVEWAESVLHNTTFPSKEARECWRLHAEGRSELEIATALTVTRWRVRAHLEDTRKRVSKVSREKRWRDEKKQRRQQIRRLVTRCDPAVLAKLVAVMMRQQGLASR